MVVVGTKILAVGAMRKFRRRPGDRSRRRHFVAGVHRCACASVAGGGPNWYQRLFNSIMRFPAEQALYGAHYAKATLEAGITTVRDLGSTDYIVAGPAQCHQRRNDSGPAHAGGQLCDRLDGRSCRSGPGAAAAHRGGAGPIRGVCNGPDECRAAVRYQIKYGADVIKFMPSGGVLSLSDPVDNPQLTQEEMNAIVSEAHAWGRKVAAHCHGDRAAKMAIAAGRGFDRARQLPEG